MCYPNIYENLQGISRNQKMKILHVIKKNLISEFAKTHARSKSIQYETVSKEKESHTSLAVTCYMHCCFQLVHYRSLFKINFAFVCIKLHMLGFVPPMTRYATDSPDHTLYRDLEAIFRSFYRQYSIYLVTFYFPTIVFS